VSKRNKKKPQIKDKPSDKKTIRVKENPESTNCETIAWHFGIIDVEHNKWGCKIIDKEVLWNKIFKKIVNLEKMNWGEIECNKKKNHLVPVRNLCNKAKKRLKEIKQDDVDDLFVIHFNGKPCLWGIRSGRVFKIIWWDPNHEVCPAIKKNT